MKPITQLTKKDIKDLKVVCFDVDGVTIKRGTEISETKDKNTTILTVKTHNLSDEMLKKIIELKKYYVVAINSGRSSMYLTKVFYDILWDKSALLSENGIFLLYEGELIQTEKFDSKILKKMRNIFVELKKLEGKNKDFRAFEPKQFLITLHAWNEIMEVHDIVKKFDPEKELYTWWNGEAFDIAPKWLNKGRALKHLADHLKIDMKQTMAIGNGINDKDMTDAAGIGVTTDPDTLSSDFYTSGSEHLGGEQLINMLLKVNES